MRFLWATRAKIGLPSMVTMRTEHSWHGPGGILAHGDHEHSLTLLIVGMNINFLKIASLFPFQKHTSTTINLILLASDLSRSSKQ